jgi:hypothetical protein
MASPAYEYWFALGVEGAGIFFCGARVKNGLQNVQFVSLAA